MNMKARLGLLIFVLVLVAALIPLCGCAEGTNSSVTVTSGDLPGSSATSSPPSAATTAGTLAPDSQLHSPEDGSPEYEAILAALGVPVEEDLQQEVGFVVDSITVQDGYAFLQGRPVQADGAPIDYSQTVYQEAVEAGAFDDAIFALLQWTDGSWNVLIYDIGATDVSWALWATDYGAPETIFPSQGD
jgi:hypothetical protein